MENNDLCHTCEYKQQRLLIILRVILYFNYCTFQVNQGVIPFLLNNYCREKTCKMSQDLIFGYHLNYDTLVYLQGQDIFASETHCNECLVIGKQHSITSHSFQGESTLVKWGKKYFRQRNIS